MPLEWKRRFTWVELRELPKVFHKDPYPKRKSWGQLGELRESVALCGVIQPIIARVKEGKLQVICGYRRWLAAQVAAVDRVPVLITRLNDSDAERLFHEENCGKSSLQQSRDTHGGVAPSGAATDNVSREDLKREKAPPAPEEVAAARRVRGNEDGSRTRQPAISMAERRLQSVVSGVGVSPDTADRTVTDSEWTWNPGPERAQREVEMVFQETVPLFEKVRRDRKIPCAEVEAVLSRLQDVHAIQNGLDIREIGEGWELDVVPGSGLEEEVTRGAVAWIAAHSLRVTALTLHFAENTAWPQKSTETLALSSFLHDVGMVFLPPEWFHSAYPLARGRQSTLQSHTRIGKELILSSGHWPKEVALAAGDHHERWDGSGYPAGKKGREVGLPARLTGLLDTYAAMVADRPYRSSFLLGEAVQMVRESAEIGLFEPALERQFRRVLTTKPVGMWGRLPDGSLMRVEEIRIGNKKSHRMGIRVTGKRYREGETIWLGEHELACQVVETPPVPRECAAGKSSSS